MNIFKLLSQLLKIILFVFLLYSCNSDEYTGSLPIENVSITEGVEITEDMAKVIALNFYNNTYNSHNYLLKTNNQISSVLSIETIKDYNNNTAIYGVNIDPHGFVLVSSNTKNVPIVAHSDNGTFEFDQNSSDGLKSWIADNIIFNDVLETKEPIKEIGEQWYYLSEGRFPYPGDTNGDHADSSYTVRYSHTINEQTGPLTSTSWGQWTPYNLSILNEYPTGCVAVALSQIMYFHKWPNTFNWSIMKPQPDGWITEGDMELAYLMSDIGSKVGMDYSATKSTANSIYAMNALINNYGYSSNAYYSDYDFNTVRREIVLFNRPVYMDGCHSCEINGSWFWGYTTNYSDCHAWVCDGYKQQYDIYIHNEGTSYEYTSQENRFEWLHMNWGWYSNGNGWFLNNYIQIIENGTTIEINGNNVYPNFQYQRKCIYNLTK